MIFPIYFHPIPHLHRGEVAPTQGDDFVHDLGSPLTNGGHKELAKTVIQLIYDLKYIVAMNYTDFIYIYSYYSDLWTQIWMAIKDLTDLWTNKRIAMRGLTDLWTQIWIATRDLTDLIMNTYIYIYVCICICMYMYVCIYIYRHIRWFKHEKQRFNHEKTWLEWYLKHPHSTAQSHVFWCSTVYHMFAPWFRGCWSTPVVHQLGNAPKNHETLILAVTTWLAGGLGQNPSEKD